MSAWSVLEALSETGHVLLSVNSPELMQVSLLFLDTNGLGRRATLLVLFWVFFLSGKRFGVFDTLLKLDLFCVFVCVFFLMKGATHTHTHTHTHTK